MDKKQLTNGLSEIGLGVILFVTALELPSILPYEMAELLIFFIKVLSFICIVIGIITTIPEVKKPENKEEWIEKKK